MIPEREARDGYWRARAEARRRLQAIDVELEKAPAYLSRARTGPWRRIDPRLQQEVDRLAQLHRDALRHREALRAIEADLDELGRFRERPMERPRMLQAFRDWVNALHDADELLRGLRPDPRRTYLGTTPQFTRDAARRVLEVRDAQGGDVGSLDVLAFTAGLDADDLRDLERTARLRMDGVPSAQAVGVLVPLRIETRFAPPDATSPVWRLRLRVFPESASFVRAAGPPTLDEIAHVEAMWREADGRLQTAEGALAFQRLVERCGGARAAWLVAALPVSRVSPTAPITVDAVVAREEAHRHFHRVVGFPHELEVWLARGGLPAVRVATMAVDLPALERQGDLRHLLIDQAPADGTLPEAWWLSYAEALKVGLATEVPLDAAPPADIDALVVVGLSRETPRPLFEGHVEAGSLAVLAPGTPTNTVAGEPTVDLGATPEFWRDVAGGFGLDRQASIDLETALLGGRGRLVPLGGGSLDLRQADEALIRALWPVLWGRAFKDVWDGGVESWDAGEWAARHLAPFGPFPTVRVGDQPYGVLPATSLDTWVPHVADPLVEGRRLVGWSRQFRDRAAAIVTAEGNVVGATTERLLQLIEHTPVSADHGWQWMLPLEWVRYARLLAGIPATMTTLEQLWEAAAAAARAEGLRPHARLEPHGVVVPVPPELRRDPRHAIRRLLAAEPEPLAYTTDLRWQELLPLLARLVRHALIIGNAEANRAAEALATGNLAALGAPLDVPVDNAGALAARASANSGILALDKLATSGHPVAEAIARSWASTRDGAEALTRLGADQLDRLLPAILDLASHRVEAWATGVASRRLRWLAARDVRWRLGAYGWVDAPRPFAARLPGTAVLPPGPTEAGMLHAPSHAQALAAALLRDRAVRDRSDPRWDIALDSRSIRIARRLGEHVRLGVHIKEALGREVEAIAGDPAIVLQLRTSFPVRPEHRGRRVCDGEQVLDAARTAPATLPGTLANDLLPLQQVIDTYGDLLLADAVYALASGRGDLAAEAMEAAAGLGPPPELRLLRTPREGRGVDTSVLAVVPHAVVATAAAAGPARIADPSFAQLVVQTLGPAASWAWIVARSGASAARVTLADAGLEPVDTLALPRARLLTRLREAAAAGASATVTSDGGDARWDAMRRLAELLSGSDAIPGWLETTGAAGTTLGAAAADLRARLVRLRAEAAGLRDRLRDAATRQAALNESVRWAVVAEGSTEDVAAESAAAALTARLDRATVPTGDDLPPPKRAIRELSGATRHPLLLTLRAGRLLDAAGLRRQAAAALGGGWLEMLAPVRPPLARVEALQLGAVPLVPAGAWRVWSTPAALADPWLQNASGGRLVAAFGPPGTIGDETTAETLLAFTVLDEWAEIVPSRTHVTEAAFGFNAPKARAPQCLLIAVPPDVSVPLDPPTLVRIVDETRRLARARMATPEALSAYDVALSLPLLLATGPSGVDLEEAAP